MKIVVPMARDMMREHNLRPRFSYDNNKIQKGARLDVMGIAADEKVPLATYMPDGHQVIEHCFAQLKAALWESIYTHGDIEDAADAQKRVRTLFLQISKESIAKNVDKMPLVYELMSTKKEHCFLGPDGREYVGTGGDWLDAAHR